MPQNKLTGLSLSYCVKDIVAGRVPYDAVDHIVASTAAASPAAWDELIAQYKNVYWHVHQDEADRVVRRLLAEGKIDQPRLRGQEHHSIASGHWMDVTTQEVFRPEKDVLARLGIKQRSTGGHLAGD